MRITARTLKAELREFWPNLGRYQIVFDPHFLAPSHDVLRGYYEGSALHGRKFHEDAFDCDDFAISFIEEVKFKRLAEIEAGTVPPDERIKYAIGAAFIPGDNLVIPDHVVNIARLDDGRKFVLDLTDGTFRLADRVADDVRLTIFY